MYNKTNFRVKHHEIDLLGIVHHSFYPLWFEAGRNDFFKNNDLPNYKLNALNLYLPLLELTCDFKSPAKYGDEIQLITSLTDASFVKLKFNYKVLNKKNEKVIANGNTTHAWTNKKLEPINLEKTYPEIYMKLKQQIDTGNLV